MIKSVTRTSLILMLPLACVTAHAQNYAGASFGRIDFSESVEGSGNLEIKPWAINTRLGHTFTENFSAELRWGTGLSAEKEEVFGETIEFDVNKMYGAYIRAGLPVEGGLMPYLVVGYTEVKVTANIDGFGSISTSDSDISYGIGLDLQTGENYVLNAEYIRLQDDDDAELDMLSVGVVFNF